VSTAIVNSPQGYTESMSSTNSRSQQHEYKLKLYIRIVRLFLEEQDSTSAETYFSRASLLYHHTSDPATQLHFKLAQARMFDFSRKFAQAASKYHEISYNALVDEAERLAVLYVSFLYAELSTAFPRVSS
jgi:COP9 signalosome complex subunit 4